MKLGELKSGDTIYKIHWGGGHIEYVETYKVGKVYDVIVGRIIHYIKPNGYDLAFTLKFSDLNNPIQESYFIDQFCADKETLINKINEDKEEVLNRYNNILNNL